MSNQSNNYIVIGGSELQLDFIQCAKRNGLNVHVIDYDSNAAGKAVADEFHCISIDEKEEILTIAKQIGAIGIHTVSTEQGNVSACYVGEQLGLATNSYQTSLNTTNKALMKSVATEKGINTPKAICITHPDEAEQHNFSLPIMVKSADRSAGRGVQLATNQQELAQAIEEAFHQSFSSEVLLEEHAEGQQYSVETISHRGKHQIVAITEQWMDGSIFCVETGHYLPARLSGDSQQAIETFCHKVLTGYDIQFGACHIEVRINHGRVTMIELASRMGGWRHWMIDYALKVDFQQAILESSLDQEPWMKLHQTDDISMCRIITNDDDITVYDTFMKNHSEKVIADFVEKPQESFKSTSLIDARGFYIYKSNEKFEENEWASLYKSSLQQ